VIRPSRKSQGQNHRLDRRGPPAATRVASRPNRFAAIGLHTFLVMMLLPGRRARSGGVITPAITGALTPMTVLAAEPVRTAMPNRLIGACVTYRTRHRRRVQLDVGAVGLPLASAVTVREALPAYVTAVAPRRNRGLRHRGSEVMAIDARIGPLVISTGPDECHTPPGFATSPNARLVSSLKQADLVIGKGPIRNEVTS
jgi:hypothetical protein